MLKYLVYNRPALLAACILIPWVSIIWWLTGDWSPLP